MRLNPPITVLALVISALAILAARHHRDGMSSEASKTCEPVIAFLEATLADNYLLEDGRKLFLTTEPTSTSLPDLTELSREQRISLEADPLWPLYRQLARVDGIDPQTNCPSLKTFLSTPKAQARFTSNPPKLKGKGEDWDAIFISVSMPAVSANGREAIMMTGLTFAPLAGGGNEVYLRKDRRGRWVVKYKQPTWIS